MYIINIMFDKEDIKVQAYDVWLFVLGGKVFVRFIWLHQPDEILSQRDSWQIAHSANRSECICKDTSY